MKKFICVQSSVHVKPPRDFNHWQQELREEQEFRRLIDRMIFQLKEARTK